MNWGRLMRCGGCAGRIAVLASLSLTASQALAQDVSPSTQEQARIRAEREAAERAVRENAPNARLEGQEAPSLGAFPEESPCFTIHAIAVDGVAARKLRWVPGYLDRFRGRCAGQQGLNYILKSLQAAFLDRALVTTRAGLPEQDLASGTLHVVVIPGVVSAVRTNGRDRHFSWDVASPLHKGDIVNLRGIEQGLEQLRRVPSREVRVDLVPGKGPGETILDVTLPDRLPVSGSVSVNNFAGATVGRWQGSVQVSALDLLGASEVFNLSYNRRIEAPGLPADSKGSGASLSFPMGWWTFGASASSNRYGQTVVGEVTDFATRGKLDAMSVWAERVIHRDRTSKTALRLALSRRWAHNFINDIEIGIQRQNLADLEIGINDRRELGPVHLDSALALRAGIKFLGAQSEVADRPAALPTARYRIVTADLGISVPFGSGPIEGWRATAHGQWSARNLYGSDLISVGGPYSVRGFDSDTAEIGRTGWFVRQELGFKVTGQFRPYALFDMGAVENGQGLRAGAGGGLRVRRGVFSLDVFAALPVIGRQIANIHKVRLGLSAAVGF
ncbi:ShlB/FhaC/HecB family hemolysin secretion/activation protein [Tsuneonella suprasediminis]|uniref:ShlB/FhaC/HecB family hemolysin secretion/activation protein n=2 Tax=Tsuneonella suprasediminis TaxID=2306996 RepID=A0A419R592_9SPHN|nr:ShlB/FhaC/HecB family hemolysin secretion/activation protein [Tsuneonella suprasediminis]